MKKLTKELTKEQLIDNLISKHIEGKKDDIMASCQISQNAPLKVRKRYLRSRCELWYEQEKIIGNVSARNDGIYRWLKNIIDEHFFPDDLDKEKVPEDSLRDMILASNSKMKINEEIEKFILSNSPQLPSLLSAESKKFSDVLNYLLNQRIRDEEKKKYTFLIADETNLSKLNSYSYKEILNAITYVEKNTNNSQYYICDFDENEEDNQLEYENLIDDIEKDVRQWVDRIDTFETLFLINNYFDLWFAFKETDFQIWDKLVKKENRNKVLDCMKSKNISLKSLHENLSVYNYLKNLDWKRISNEIEKKIDDLNQEPSKYDETFEVLKENIIKKLNSPAYYSLVYSNKIYIEDNIHILNSEKNVEYRLINFLDEIISNFYDEKKLEELEERWNLFSEIYLAFVNTEMSNFNSLLVELNIDEVQC